MNVASLGILDQYDVPQAEMLVVIWTEGGRSYFEYVAAFRSRWGPARLCHPGNFTSLGDFGMSASFTEDEDLRVVPSDRPCVAQDHNGLPRNWHGRDNTDPIALRPTVVRHVWQAVQAAQDAEQSRIQILAEFELDRALRRIGVDVAAITATALSQVEDDLSHKEMRADV